MDATPTLNTPDADSETTVPHRRRLTYLLAIALVCYWLIAFAGTHIPIPAGVIPRGGGDKVLHLVGYAILGALLMGLRASRGPFGWRSVIVRWAVLAMYGAFDEVTQRLVGRHADVADWCADLIGAAFGLGLVVLLVRACSPRSVKCESMHSTDKAA